MKNKELLRTNIISIPLMTSVKSLKSLTELYL